MARRKTGKIREEVNEMVIFHGSFCCHLCGANILADGRWLEWLDSKIALLIDRDGVDPRDYGGKSYEEYVHIFHYLYKPLMVVSGSLPRQLSLRSNRRMKASSDAKHVKSCSGPRHLLKNISPINIPNS